MRDIEETGSGPCRQVFFLDVGIPDGEFKSVEINHVGIQGQMLLKECRSNGWGVGHDALQSNGLHKHRFRDCSSKGDPDKSPYRDE